MRSVSVRESEFNVVCQWFIIMVVNTDFVETFVHCQNKMWNQSKLKLKIYALKMIDYYQCTKLAHWL